MMGRNYRTRKEIDFEIQYRHRLHPAGGARVPRPSRRRAGAEGALLGDRGAHASRARPHGSRAAARDLDASGQGLGGPDEGLRAQGRAGGEDSKVVATQRRPARGGFAALSDQSYSKNSMSSAPPERSRAAISGLA